MPNIGREFEQLVRNYRNEAVADVTTATPLDDGQRAIVKQGLERLTGKTIIMQTRSDPSILGGVVARVGDQVIDGSVRHRLSALQHQLLNNVSMAGNDLLADEIAQAVNKAEMTPSSYTGAQD